MATQCDSDDDDGMDAFMDKFKKEKYKNALSEDNWEAELDKIPIFMKDAPDDFDPKEYPELACLQAMLHDEDCTPEEQAENFKNEGNAFFKEKDYKKAVVAYTAGLQKKCQVLELNTVLLTNRAAAHFHLGNMRSAFNDAAAARKLKPDHLKALIRGAQCCIELRSFVDAIQWCDEGLKLYPTDRKLQELRAAADKHKRVADRDARKARVKGKKVHDEKEHLLAAIKARGIKLFHSAKPRPVESDSDNEASEFVAELSVDGLGCKEATGAQVYLDQQGALQWPVFFLYPEHQQSDFISAFCENNSFIDHLAVMFGEELPPWDVDRKYRPQHLQLFFEDVEKETLHRVCPESTLLEVLQHKRFFIKAGTPSFIVLVDGSPFCRKFLTGKKIK